MKKKIVVLFLLLLSIISIIFVSNNDFLYKDEIMKITNIKIEKIEKVQNTIGIEEEYYMEKITGIITNGKSKNTEKTIEYERTYSSVITDKYRVGDKVFVKKNEITGLKRDVYITFLIVSFIILIYIVGEYKGLLSIVSVIFNIIIFYIGLDLYFKGINLLFLCIIESIVFSIFSLFIAGGINKKTVSAIVSVFTSVIILLILVLIVVTFTKYDGINFNELSYLTVPPEDIIIPELLIGSLGAIMDVAITMSSSINELIEKDKNISIKNLTISSKQIGKDIMSTMTNVLFFTYILSGLPIFILAIRNGFGFYNYISSSFSLELTRFLVGSIGIVMSIPFSTFISIKIFKRGAK